MAPLDLLEPCMSRIAYISPDRQLHVVNPEGEQDQQLTQDLPRGGGP